MAEDNRGRIQDPCVSIIVPFFNQEKHLGSCLASIEKQSYTNYEVLLIDDGSTDQSGWLAQVWAEKKRFAYFEKKNEGAGSARNFGLMRAEGDYIMFVDSDDLIHSELVDSLLKISLRTSCAISAVCKADFAQKPIFDAQLDGFKRCSALELIQNGTTACGRLYRKELFDRPSVLFPEHIWAEDSGYIPYLADRATSIFMTSKIGYAYRNTGASSAGASLRCIQDAPLAMNYLFSIMGNNRRLFTYVATRTLNAAVHGLAQRPETRAADFHRFTSTPEFRVALANLRLSLKILYIRDFNSSMKSYALGIFLWCYGVDYPIKQRYLHKFAIR